ncbi:MAG: hydrogenase [Oligoflexia bacterium]|nr:hydrogenase [Oligoflexia bacterium]
MSLYDAYIGLLSLILLTCLASLSMQRLRPLIKTVALQGIAVTMTTLLYQQNVHFLLPFIMIIVKGVLIPMLLLYTLKKVSIKSEGKPIVGFHASVLLGILFLFMVIHYSHDKLSKLLADQSFSFSVAVVTIACGLFLMMARRKALTQVVGYLIMDNGIYLMGALFLKNIPFVLEFAILLDLLVAVMVMGIILHKINETFNSIDTTSLATLKDRWHE